MQRRTLEFYTEKTKVEEYNKPAKYHKYCDVWQTMIKKSRFQQHNKSKTPTVNVSAKKVSIKP